MLGVFRGMLRGARRIPMTSKRGKKSFYKGKVDMYVSSLASLTLHRRVWSRCNDRVVAEESNYQPLRLGTLRQQMRSVKTADLIGHIKFLHSLASQPYFSLFLAPPTGNKEKNRSLD